VLRAYEEIAFLQGVSHICRRAYAQAVSDMFWGVKEVILVREAAAIAYINGSASNNIVANAQTVRDRLSALNSPMILRAADEIDDRRVLSTIASLAKAQAKPASCCDSKYRRFGIDAAEIASRSGSSSTANFAIAHAVPTRSPELNSLRRLRDA